MGASIGPAVHTTARFSNGDTITYLDRQWNNTHLTYTTISRILDHLGYGDQDATEGSLDLTEFHDRLVDAINHLWRNPYLGDHDIPTTPNEDKILRYGPQIAVQAAYGLRHGATHISWS